MAPRRAFNESLDRLRDELATSTSLSAADRGRLESLIADLEIRVDAESDGEDDEPDSLSERLLEAREQFEEEHPNLTFAIGAVAEALSRLGI